MIPKRVCLSVFKISPKQMGGIMELKSHLLITQRTACKLHSSVDTNFHHSHLLLNRLTENFGSNVLSFNIWKNIVFKNS